MLRKWSWPKWQMMRMQHLFLNPIFKPKITPFWFWKTARNDPIEWIETKSEEEKINHHLDVFNQSYNNILSLTHEKKLRDICNFFHSFLWGLFLTKATGFLTRLKKTWVDCHVPMIIWYMKATFESYMGHWGMVLNGAKWC